MKTLIKILGITGSLLLAGAQAQPYNRTLPAASMTTTGKFSGVMRIDRLPENAKPCLLTVWAGWSRSAPFKGCEAACGAG
jgi:hypothetical protein